MHAVFFIYKIAKVCKFCYFCIFNRSVYKIKARKVNSLRIAILLILSVAFFSPIYSYAEDDDVSMLMSKLNITTDAGIRQEIYAQLCALYRNEAEEVPERIKAINEANEKGLKSMAAVNAAYICRNYYNRNMIDSLSVWVKYVSSLRSQSSAAYFYAKYFETMALLDRGCCYMAEHEAVELRAEAVKRGEPSGKILTNTLLGNVYKKSLRYAFAASAYGSALAVLSDGSKVDADIVENLFMDQARTLIKLGQCSSALAVLDRFNSLVARKVMPKYEGYVSKPGKYSWELTKLYLDCYLTMGNKDKIEQYYEKMVIDSENNNNKADLEMNYLRARYLMQKNELDNALDEIDYALARVSTMDLDYLIFKSNLQRRMGNEKGALTTYKAVCDSLRSNFTQYMANDVRMLTSSNQSLMDFVPHEEYVEQTNVIGKLLEIIILVALLLLATMFVMYFRHKYLSKKLAATNKVLAEEKANLEKITSDLEKTYREAEQSNIKRNEFLETVSHEVRTPLNSIVGFSDMILDGEDVDDAEKEYVNIIVMNSDLMLKLVNDILDLSQLDNASGVNVDIAPTDVKDVATKVLSAIKPLVKPGVNVSLTCDDGEMVIYSDHYRLQQLLTNLLGNAAKFTTTGSINLDIRHSKNSVVFSVTDTGCGISKEDRKRIFKRYEKLNESAKGTGLGLYISMLISKKLGGKIYLDDNYNTGARFVFEHPMRLQFGQKLISDDDDREEAQI